MTREDLGGYLYQPALQRVSIVDVHVPHDLKIGVTGRPAMAFPSRCFHQLGMDVTLIPAEKLASEDLSPYGTIVLGIRASNEKDVVENNKKLLDYVAAGGTLVVQYNTGVADFNNGHSRHIPPN